MYNDEMPAMPVSCTDTDMEARLSSGEYVKGADCTGMSKREYLAGMALQGLMANHNSHIAFHSQDAETMATMAIANADALLRELEK